MKLILITGASGFLGGRAAAHFALLPGYRVRATSRSSKKTEQLESLGCEYLAGDLTDAEFTKRLIKGVNIVIHCAALSAPYGRYSDFESANIDATKCLLAAAESEHVERFVFISTPSIYVDLTPKYNVTEISPIPTKLVNNYADTKLIAEKIVLNAHGGTMSTLALRPRAIIGAEDTVIFPRVLKAYDEGKLKIVGTGKNQCDLTCARNIVEAIHCAILADDSAYGEAYNITNDEPVNFWETLNYALTSLGYSPVKKRIPKSIAIAVAKVVEGWFNRFKPNSEPTLTAYGIAVLADDFTMDISKAKNRLNYRPVMTTREGIDEFVNWHKQQ